MYLIETSSNLFDGVPLTSRGLTNGVLEFTVGPATEPQRLYRATVVP
jgi:hypothetical protein